MKLKLNNVRLSFPSLFEPTSFEGSKPSFKATFILDKKAHKTAIAEIQIAIAAVITEKWQGKLKQSQLKGVCLRDGSEKADMDGYGDEVMFVSSSNSKRFPVVDKDLTPLDSTDTKPYAGCYVNATIELWAQDNQFGKRVNAQVKAVQFSREGEPFGDKTVNVEDEFEKIEDDSVL